MYAVAIILARCGSKGIPYKNILPINGKPLIAYSLEALANSRINKYFVSTDCENIANVAKKYGASIIDRPQEFSNDLSSSKDALIHAVSALINKPDYILLIQATSPLIIAEDINETINLLHKYDSVVSVVEDHSFLWLENNGTLKPKNHDISKRQPRQLLQKTFKETGSIYGTKYTNLIQNQQILSGSIGTLEIPKNRSFEIDDYEDVFIVESIIKNMK